MENFVKLLILEPQLTQLQLQELLILSATTKQVEWLPFFAKKHNIKQTQLKDIIKKLEEAGTAYLKEELMNMEANMTEEEKEKIRIREEKKKMRASKSGLKDSQPPKVDEQIDEKVDQE